MDDFTKQNPKWFYNISEVPELKILQDNFEIILMFYN